MSRINDPSHRLCWLDTTVVVRTALYVLFFAFASLLESSASSSNDKDSAVDAVFSPTPDDSQSMICVGDLRFTTPSSQAPSVVSVPWENC